MAPEKKKKNWFNKLRTSYRLVFLNESTFEERFSVRLTRILVITTLLSLAVLFITLTFFVIAYTPLKEYIPGYPDVKQKKELYKLNKTIDSLIVDVKVKSVYLENIKRIIENKPPLTKDSIMASKKIVDYDTIEDIKSKQDSLLRASFENQAKFNLFFPETEAPNIISGNVLIQSQNFFKPLDGIITSPFNAMEKHYGIDIVASHNEAVKAVLDGTVIISSWTLETGYVILLQHKGNILSVYKHCATLLKQEGELVKAGEPIAIAGNSGEDTSGPHLHFELWYNGSPVNPVNYINFN